MASLSMDDYGLFYPLPFTVDGDKLGDGALLHPWLQWKGAAAMAETIGMDDFAKLDLRVGKVINAQKVHGKDKLLVLQVDIGTETRTVVAGIAQEFSVEELVGKQVVFVANLEPKRIGGIVSQGMILAAGEEQALAIVTLDREVPPGTRVR